MQRHALTPTRDIWLDHHQHEDEDTSPGMALLCQLCSKEMQWRSDPQGHVCCTMASKHAGKTGKQYSKFLRLLYIQGIIGGGYLAGAYERGPDSFDVCMSEVQFRQMRSFYLALKRKQSGLKWA